MEDASPIQKAWMEDTSLILPYTKRGMWRTDPVWRPSRNMPHATGLGPISPHRGRLGRSAFAARQRRDAAEHAVLRGRLARPFGSREQHPHGAAATRLPRSAASPHTVVRASEHGGRHATAVASRLTPAVTARRGSARRSDTRTTALLRRLTSSSTVEAVIAARKSRVAEEEEEGPESRGPESRLLGMSAWHSSNPTQPATAGDGTATGGVQETKGGGRRQEDEEGPSLVVKLRIGDGGSLSRGGERRDHQRSPLGGSASAWDSAEGTGVSIEMCSRRRRQQQHEPPEATRGKRITVVMERRQQPKQLPALAVNMADLFAAGSSTLPSRENSARKPRLSRTRERWRKYPGGASTSSSSSSAGGSAIPAPTDFGVFVYHKRANSPNYPEYYERDDNDDDVYGDEAQDTFPSLLVPRSSPHLLRSHANVSRGSLGTSGRLMEAHRRRMETMKFRSMTGSPNTGKRDRKAEREERRRKQEARAQRLMLELKQTLADKKKHKRLLASEQRLFTAEFELRDKLSKPLPAPANCHLPSTCHPRLHPSSPNFAAFYPLVADDGASADDLGRALSHNRLSQYKFNEVGPPPPQLRAEEARSLQRELLESQSRNREERERLSGAFWARMGGMDGAVEVMNETLDVVVAHEARRRGKRTGVLLEADEPPNVWETRTATLPPAPRDRARTLARVPRPGPAPPQGGGARVSAGETIVTFSEIGLPTVTSPTRFRKPKTFYPTKVQQDALWGYHRETGVPAGPSTDTITTDAEAEAVYSMLFHPAR